MSVRDVTSYGATGNGTTDDTAAFQACANACLAGDQFFMPSAIFYKVDAITFSGVSNVTVTGPDTVFTAIVKKPIGGSNAPIFSVSGGSGFVFEKFEINGQGPSQSWWDPNAYTADGTVFANNIQITGGSGHIVRNIYTHLAGSAGVRLYGATNCLIELSTGDNNGFGSFVAYHNGAQGSNDLIIQDCVASFDYCDCFRIVQSNRPIIQRCIGHHTRAPVGPPAYYTAFYFEIVDAGIIRFFESHHHSAIGCDFSPGTTNAYVHDGYSNFNAGSGFLTGGDGCTYERVSAYGNAGWGMQLYGNHHTARNVAFHGNSQGIGGGGDNFHMIAVDLRFNAGGPINPGIRFQPGFSEVGTVDDDNEVFIGSLKNNAAMLFA